MPRHRKIKFKTLIIIAGLGLVAATYFILRPTQSTTEPELAANTDFTDTNENIVQPASATKPASGLSTTAPAAAVTPLSPSAEAEMDQPIRVIPTLTLGSPPLNPAVTQPQQAADLRQRYLAAVRDGTWPKPERAATKTQHPKTETASGKPGLNSGAAITHTVRKGETLSSIASQYYGRPDRWRSIYDANRKTIGTNPNRLRVGQKLIIPPQNP